MKDTKTGKEDALKQIEIEERTYQAKTAHVYLMEIRERMRPHRQYGTTVYYLAEEDTFVCEIQDFYHDEDDEDTEGSTIRAFGDTPAAACDNFDNLWVHGQTDIGD